MKRITWQDEYNLGIPIIDQQHRRWIELIGQLEESVERSMDPLAYSSPTTEAMDLVSILNGITEYADFHFATEEKFFKKFHYENAKEHIALHHQMRDKVNQLKHRQGKHNTQVLIDTLDYMQTWLIDHILGQDRLYVQCFHEHGL